MVGGERRVVELLEYETEKHLSEPLLEGEDKNQAALQNRSFKHFFLRPRVLGQNLYTIVKFGLVQYVSCRNSSYSYSMLVRSCRILISRASPR